MLFIHDPEFVEKLLNFVPEYLDWNFESEFFGRNGVGHYTILDMRTDDTYEEYWQMFVSTMNLN